uniref:Fibronectin type-III domain-containing protein n=1 Tax=Macrostomum lignano TaxID=282301 RepID=A0A1I8FFW5_9PLAT
GFSSWSASSVSGFTSWAVSLDRCSGGGLQYRFKCDVGRWPQWSGSIAGAASGMQQRARRRRGQAQQEARHATAAATRLCCCPGRRIGAVLSSSGGLGRDRLRLLPAGLTASIAARTQTPSFITLSWSHKADGAAASLDADVHRLLPRLTSQRLPHRVVHHCRQHRAAVLRRQHQLQRLAREFVDGVNGAGAQVAPEQAVLELRQAQRDAVVAAAHVPDGPPVRACAAGQYSRPCSLSSARRSGAPGRQSAAGAARSRPCARVYRPGRAPHHRLMYRRPLAGSAARPLGQGEPGQPGVPAVVHVEQHPDAAAVVAGVGGVGHPGRTAGARADGVQHGVAHEDFGRGCRAVQPQAAHLTRRGVEEHEPPAGVEVQELHQLQLGAAAQQEQAGPVGVLRQRWSQVPNSSVHSSATWQAPRNGAAARGAASRVWQGGSRWVRQGGGARALWRSPLVAAVWAVQEAVAALLYTGMQCCPSCRSQHSLMPSQTKLMGTQAGSRGPLPVENLQENSYARPGQPISSWPELQSMVPSQRTLALRQRPSQWNSQSAARQMSGDSSEPSKTVLEVVADEAAGDAGLAVQAAELVGPQAPRATAPGAGQSISRSCHRSAWWRVGSGRGSGRRRTVRGRSAAACTAPGTRRPRQGSVRRPSQTRWSAMQRRGWLRLELFRWGQENWPGSGQVSVAAEAADFPTSAAAAMSARLFKRCRRTSEKSAASAATLTCPEPGQFSCPSGNSSSLSQPLRCIADHLVCDGRPSPATDAADESLELCKRRALRPRTVRLRPEPRPLPTRHPCAAMAASTARELAWQTTQTRWTARARGPCPREPAAPTSSAAWTASPASPAASSATTFKELFLTARTSPRTFAGRPTASSHCDGRCLKASVRCDGTIDCSSGQDEIGCPGRGNWRLQLRVLLQVLHPARGRGTRACVPIQLCLRWHQRVPCTARTSLPQ